MVALRRYLHRMWRPVDRPWQYEVLDRLPAGVDVTLIDESLKRTPTERVERLMELLRAMEELQRAREAKGPGK